MLVFRSLVISFLFISTLGIGSQANSIIPIISLLLLDDEECQVLNIPRSVRQNFEISSGCYDVLDSIDVESTLTIQPGTILRFAKNKVLWIREGGILKAVGSESSASKFREILMTGSEKIRGHWRGLRIDSSSEITELKYLTIEYAGTDGNSCDSSLCISGQNGRNARATISDVTIQHSSYAGFNIFSDARIDQFERVISTNNVLPGIVQGRNLHLLNNTSKFVGNDTDYIYVKRSQIFHDRTWHKLDVPYYMETQDINRSLSIDEGVFFNFLPETRLMMNGPNASLNAIGSELQPIIFTTLEPNSTWFGLEFIRNTNTMSVLKHIHIDKGGFSHFQTNPRGNINMFCGSLTPTTLNISDSRIFNSLGWGVVSDDPGCTLNQTNNIFSGNPAGDVL